MNTLFKNKTLVVALFCGLAISMSANKSFAGEEGDKKSFPASMCQTTFGGQGKAYYTSSAGVISNVSTTESLVATCPVVRDDMASTLGLKKIRVSFVDSHPTLDVRCQLTYYNPAKNSTRTFDLTKEQGNSILKFEYCGNQSCTAGKEITTYSVSCTLPPKVGNQVSRLTSVEYLE